MRVVALISGGKDSIFNALCTKAEGHELVALANLHPRDKDELDSYMYQTVGHMGIVKIAEAMELPLYRRETRGTSVQRGKLYEPTDDDEVEDLFELLSEIRDKESIEAVASGAILSDYQRVRVENVCQRLNLVSLSYLWRRDQSELLQEMIDCKIDAILIKVAALGLTANYLGKSIAEMRPILLGLSEKYNLNVCGEGGEYETFTLDCPLFKKRIEIEDMQVIISSSDPVCPVGYINFTKLKLVSKSSPSKIIWPRTSLQFIKYTSDDDDEMFLKLKDNAENDDVMDASDESERVTQSLQVNQGTKDTLEEKTLASVVRDHEVWLKGVQNTPTAVENKRGWLWVAGLQSASESPTTAVTELLQKLQQEMEGRSFELRDLVRITLYVGNMAQYLEINAAYVSVITFQNPPTRICVECVMPPGCTLIVEAVAHRHPASSGSKADISTKRNTLHVQGISHWAPANIGPYSQSIKIGSITYISGQIALVPGTMQLLEDGITDQSRLVLRHISRVAEVMQVKRKLRDVVQGICYVTKRSHVDAARREWESQSTNAIVDYVIVSRLPRDALIELQVWAHNYNDKFEYEETGCSIGNYSISLKKRWNYESECVAAICTVSTYTSSATTPTTPMSTSFTRESDPFQQSSPKPGIAEEVEMAAKSMQPEHLRDVLDYLIRKMLPYQSPAGSSSEGTTLGSGSNYKQSPPAIHIRLFCDILKAPEFIFDVTDAFRRDKANVQIAFSVIPVCGLQKVNDFISICAIKHE